jgi:hypothetical protein
LLDAFWRWPLRGGQRRHRGFAPVRRTPALSFGPPEWLPADALDDAYFRYYPRAVCRE